jgi:transcriptional regulator of heat shock response
MDPRTQEILEAAVREFIATGEPVSSEELYRNYDFGIKPAMIRWELNELVERGFLEQAHHSAGRMPTDEGYEFFAERLLAAADPVPKKDTSELAVQHSWEKIAARMSEDLGVIGAAMLQRQGLLFKGFLENFIDNFEWQDRSELKSVIRDFEELDQRFAAAKRLFEAQDEFLRVFIGKKSPITTSENVSVIAGSFEQDGQRIILCAIGPKRMDYEKTTRLFKGLKSKKRSHGGKDGN